MTSENQTSENQVTKYLYDGAGNRVYSDVNGILTGYVRDAQGNTLGVYDMNSEGNPFWWPVLTETYIYGSNRIGVDLTARVHPRLIIINEWHKDLTTTRYELTNHLGNVLTTVTGRKLGQEGGTPGEVDHYLPEVVTATDYYPFGQEMPGRTYTNIDLLGTNGYRYGFNGKELDKSGEFGSLNHYDYGFRIYNPAIGKFLSVDPLADQFADLTPYNYVMNNPIRLIDPFGLSPEDPGDPPCKDCAASVTLPEITFSAKKNQGSYYNQEPERYGYRGDWNSYKADFGLEDWSYENYKNFYEHVHRANNDVLVAAQDKLEAERIAVEKMTYWMGTVFPPVVGFSLGGLFPRLPSTSGFNFNSLSRSSSSNGWQTLSSLDDVNGVPGLYQFPHALRALRQYTGQAVDIGKRLETHFKLGNIGGNILFKPMLGSTRLTREIMETRVILNLGRGSLNNTANLRYPVSKLRDFRKELNIYK